LKYRHLGVSGPLVSAVGLGCYGMAGGYGPADEAEAMATVVAALDYGINLLDTSDTYGAGRNEELVGRAVRGRREKAFIVTKFGNPGRDANNRPTGVCGRPDYVPIACERSLRRLGVETIDLYLVHRVDPKVPIEDTVGAMAGLVKEGKVRHIGLCEAAPETIRRAHSVYPLAAVQSEYSLWSRDPDTGGHVATCRERGVAFMAYSPLGRGFLAGAVAEARFAAGDPRVSMPRFQPENLPHNLTAFGRFKAIAADLGMTPPQLALAWLLAQGDDILPIPGTRRVDHLRENAAAAHIRLSADDLARVETALSPAAIRGRRYDDEYMKSLDI
jgi:aryl-alcohol dehydrogenase-like predicted oxidoreductase